MLPNQNPTLTKSWSNLEHLAEQAKSVKMSKLFQENAKRFEQFSIENEGFLLEYSKNIITNEIFNISGNYECQNIEVLKNILNI